MDAKFYKWFSTFQFKILVVLLLSLTVMQVTAAEPEPKKDSEAVYVTVEQARLYAGPSTDFYPTGDAKRGTVLEVYHRLQNGWLGVRPPQGSFSWVPASQAYLLPGGRVIEITDANSVSWIGTELGSAKQYRWQVQLKVGEQLTVLGEATIKNEADDREALWYKVSPPAGEFRWIEQVAVSKTAPPVKTTDALNESQIVLKSNEPTSATQSKSNGSNPAETNNAKANTSKVEKSVVQPASFESASAQPGRSPKRTSVNSRKQSAEASEKPTAGSNRSPHKDEWDGWYAFEMSEQGVRTPFLDKLSGRDRGQSSHSPKLPTSQHDPLIHDPFSLAMAGEPQKPLPSDLNAVAKKQREWRDPRSLREARLAGPTSTQSAVGSMVAHRDGNNMANSPSVMSASSDNMKNADTNGAVSTAEYEHNQARPLDTFQEDARANVNWYGLAESSSVGAQGPESSKMGSESNTLNVVTSTADVGELQVALNNAVASSNGPWNLSPLAERARYLIEHGPTAIDRGQARLLLERIEAFQSVSARTQQITGTAPLQNNPVQSASFQTNPHNMTLPNSPRTEAATYEATGWLVPVHAAGPDQPTHALTNDTGDVVAYVSPIAGLNLDRYRNQAVGINGLRGYLPQLQSAHIQAQRVSRIR